METVMNTILSTATARRALVSTLTVIALTTMLPQTGVAQVSFENGMWKLDNANTNPGTLSLGQRGEAVAANAGKLILIRKGKAYEANGQAAKDILAGKYVDESRLMLIGTNVRSETRCNFRCQGGQPERQAALSFIPADGGGPRSIVAVSK